MESPEWKIGYLEGSNAVRKLVIDAITEYQNRPALPKTADEAFEVILKALLKEARVQNEQA